MPIPGRNRALASPLCSDAGSSRYSRRQTAPLTCRLIPNFLDVTLVALDSELDHNVDKQVQETLYVLPSKLTTAGALLDEQNQLFEGEFRARGMHARNRARMSGIDVTQ